MTVELTPVGVRCNLSCPYCYQGPMRDAGNFTRASYDVDAMLAGLAEEGQPFTVFGGEALLTPIEDLERIWRWGYERYGRNGIQTNGTLITDAHIELFRRYNVHVGISVDGPDELNDTRWAGSLEKTRAATAASMAAIDRLCAVGWPPSLIVTLSRANATDERLPRLKAWVQELDRKGVSSMRLHTLEVDHPEVGRSLALSEEENVRALLEMAALERELERLRFDVFRDILTLLKGEAGSVTCVWNSCDPYTTAAVRGVDSDGTRSNCGRTNKDGIAWVKTDRPGYERQLALYHTPQEYGGCQGCRFFVLCRGECPGTGEDMDWRNRSDQCGIWKSLFEHFEAKLLDVGIRPISLHPELRRIEQAALDAWERGENISVAQALARATGKAGQTEVFRDGMWHTHCDTPHGDSHADSWGSRERPLGRAMVVA